MKIYAVDFEKVVKNYKNYVSKMLEQDQVRMNYQVEMEVFKKEMESIISSANSSLIVDDATRNTNIQRFKEIQMEAGKREGEFKSKFTESQNDIMESSFEEISNIINEYAVNSEIDMIVSKSQLVFVKDALDITDMIIIVLKDRDLYYEATLETV